MIKTPAQKILIGLLLLVAAKQSWMAMVTPRWEVPDEPAHVGYVQAIVEEQRWPVWNRIQDLSVEIRGSLTAEEVARHRAHPFYQPGSLSVDINYAQPRRATSADRPPANFAAPYAPLYYLYEAVPYRLLQSQSIEARLLGMRLATVLLLVVFVWLSYWAVRDSLGSTLALVIAAVVGWHPLTTYIFAGVNNDSLAAVFGALTFGLLLRLWRRGRLEWPMVVALGVTIGLGMANKQHALIYIPVAVGVLLLVRRGQPRQVLWPRLVALALLAVGLGLSWSLYASSASPRDFINEPLPTTPPPITVTWQFVLEKYFVNRAQFAMGTFWGIPGWNGSLAHWRWEIYGYTALATIAAFGHAVFLVARRRFREHHFELWRGLTLSVITAVILEVLFFYLYAKNAFVYQTFHFPSHGRYYLIAFLPLSVMFVIGLTHFWRPRWRPLILGAIVAMMVGLSLAMIPLVQQLPGLTKS